MAIPGLAVHLRGPRNVGKAALWTCAGLLLVFVLFLGYQVGNIAFALLLSVHVTGLLYFLQPAFGNLKLGSRFLLSIAVLMALSLFLYLPLRNFFQNHFFAPLRTQNRVIVVTRFFFANSLRRGDWLAFRFEEATGHGYRVKGGVGFGPVLALPGDRVRFTPDGVEVNGRVWPRRLHMPGQGEFRLPGNCWFVWPDVAKMGYVNAPAGPELSSALISAGTIEKGQIVGKPCRRWFWRRQDV
jgi:hypothetical protein